ncbi:MAG: NAD-dependent epimerase/dehydratase family protein [Deltaproteobacteria bacterium]|nr:NAD-dependent epimerase/dehydratase family protein [Deltaproteobacteria bacterium]
MQKIFIAGCGYIGERIARSCRDSGTDPVCLVRSAEHGTRLAAAGYKVIVSTLDDVASLPQLDLTESTVFYLVPPPGGGVIDTRARAFIDTVLSRSAPAKIIYMSATSVYSETHGGVVTEESPAIPASAMGKRRLDAESAFMEYGRRCNVPVVVLRVSGIYGPGRLPLMQISQGQPLLREEESGPSNRIHADDLATACLAAGRYGENGDIINVSDGNPSSMTAYFNACADVLRLQRQPQVTLAEAARVMSPLMFSYVSESRIVDNSRMLERLKVALRYPSMLEGLKASVD